MALRIIPARKTLPPVESALQAEADALQAALDEDPRQKRLNIIRETLEQLGDLRQAERQLSTRRAYRAASSVLEGAEFAMQDENRPLLLSELMEMLPRYGKTPGGNKPNWNLSNQMSFAKSRFQSIEYDGEKRWWLAGKEVPKK